MSFLSNDHDNSSLSGDSQLDHFLTAGGASKQHSNAEHWNEDKLKVN